MPRIFRAIGDEFNHRFSRKDNASANEFVGFQGNGAVVVRDRRGTLKAEIPNVDEKSQTLGGDSLAIYKPSGSKSVDAAKAMSSFTGWAFTAVNAIASEFANIKFPALPNRRRRLTGVRRPPAFDASRRRQREHDRH